MSLNYAPPLAVDKFGTHLYNSPPNVPARANTVRENASTSSVTAVGADTTAIEVAAVGAGAAIRWSMQSNLTATSSVITAAGTAAYDNIIPAGTKQLFVIPRQAAGVPSIVGANALNGLYNGVATKSLGVGSVLLAEF